MSKKEIKKTEVMSQLANRQITQKMAAEQLELSVGQVKRIWKNTRKKELKGYCIRAVEKQAIIN